MPGPRPPSFFNRCNPNPSSPFCLPTTARTMELDDAEPAHTMPFSHVQDRSRLQYELTVRQEPKQARMCGIGGKADRRPIDPPVIVQLRVIDPAAPPPPAPASDSTTSSTSASASNSNSSSNANAPPDEPAADDEPPYTNLAGYAQSFLQNPYYFMFASLAKPDDDTELHWLKDGRTRCTTGSVVSSLYALKDPTAAPPPNANSTSSNSASNSNSNSTGKDAGPTTAPPASDAGFFVFPDLSVRTEGSYRLKLSLFEVVGNDVRHCKSIYSAPFYVYTAKKFPGVEESSPLTCSLADQGIKIRIRKDIRMRKARVPGLGAPLGGDTRGGGLIGPPPSEASGSGGAAPIPMPTVDPDPVDDKDQHSSRRPAKRSRTDDGSNNTGGAPPVGTPWPSTPLIPPPPGAEIQGGGGTVTIQPAPSQQQQQQGMQMPAVIPPPPPPVAPAPAQQQDMNGYDSRYVPSPYDAGGHAPAPSHPQQQQHPGHQQQQQQHPGQQQQQQHIPPPPPPGYRTDAMPPPPPPPHHYPPQYQHPHSYYYPPPGPGPYGYGDPYAHHHPQHPQHQHPQQHQSYAPPPPPPHPHAPRYDLNYAYPPHPHQHHYPPAPGPYYEQPQPQPPQPQQQQQQQPQQGQYGEYAPQPQQGYGPPPGANPNMAAPNPNMAPPNAGMAPNPSPNPIANANPNPNVGVGMAPNPNARGPPPPQQYAAYRPYAQPPPPPYYGYGQPQPQPGHEAHAWGTPPTSGYVPPVGVVVPPQQWGEYAPQQPQQAVVPVPSQQVQAPQGQVGALRSPNARIELAPLRGREDDGVGGERSPPQGAHAVIQLRSGSAASATGRGGGSGAGKKNPLSIGSIISDENSKH
ncbi:velvet factor-domain-containing protein [Mycena polygramma]|nr:velvet factor-domain-containing protein [Mycena polygramma]